MDFQNLLAQPVSRLGDLPMWIGFSGLIVGAVLIWQLDGLVKLIAALPRKSAFKRKELLTENETEFFRRLKRALPECEVMTQVAMGALMEPIVSQRDARFWDLRRQFSEKICDYVITCGGRPRGRRLVVIELDDRTHDARKDAARDELLAGVGIRTVRYESRNKPDEQRIREQVLPLLGMKPA